MSWQTRTTHPRRTRVVQSSRRWRRIGAALLMGLALTIAACGSTTGVGAPPTPTPKATATATPVPCTTWRIIPSPGGTRYPDNILTSVSARSPTDAWAVGGNYAEGGTIGPAVSLIERWNGTSWQTIANPGPNFLSGVAELSPTDVWAVGEQWITTGPSNGNGGWRTLTMHWNGTQWSIVPSPTPSGSENGLSSVLALAANDVWAVGNGGLIERWDGIAWHVATSPPLPAGATAWSFTALTHIPATGQLWAVGSVRYGSAPSGGIGYFQPLVERWDGTAWHIVAAPTLPNGSFAGSLKSVVALSATDAWAVGDYTASNHIIHTLIAHWDGTTWQVAASPNAWGSLASVAATGTHDVRAVGSITNDDGTNEHLLIEQWDGTAWHIATNPEPSGISYRVGSITTDGSGSYWAVGSYSGPGAHQYTLALHCP